MGNNQRAGEIAAKRRQIQRAKASHGAFPALSRDLQKDDEIGPGSPHALRDPSGAVRL